MVRFAGTLGLLLAATSAAQPQTPATPQVAFEKFTLSNGLQVIFHIDKKLPVVHVNLWYHVGSRNERVGRSGFAHLFEHMMFEGSKNANQKYFTYAERAGARVFEGGVNGTTDWDRTNYFATVPSANLEKILWLESDRLATLAEAIDQKRFENQRDVVKNERRQGLENQPYGRWIKLICENLYPARHPYANDVIGTHEDLSAATVEDVRDFFHTYYTPNNLSMVIAGDFDPAEARRLVEKYFGNIPAGPALDRPPRWIPKLDGERTIEVSDRVPQERTYFAWQSPAFFDPGDAELDLTSTILTDGISSRLNKLLVRDKQLCSDVVSFQLTREAGSAFILWATARPGAALPDIEHLVTAEIARLAKEGPSEAELNRARTKWEFNFISGLERIGGFGGKADILNTYNTYLGDPGKFEADLARHRNVTVERLRATVAGWLDTRNRLLVRFHPETSGRPMEIALDRSNEPPLAADRPFQAPGVKTTKLENGIQVMVVERRDLPKVAVRLATRAGSADDPPEKAGLADLTVILLRRGTRTRDALAIDEAMGDLGTSIYGETGPEGAFLGFEVLKRNLDAALAIFADIARNPVFPAEEVELEKKRRLDSLSQTAKDPWGIGMRVSAMLAFGARHPYGRPPAGLPATVEKLTREDFVRFHETYWKPASTALLFAGDISLEEAAALARRAFGDWKGGARPALSIPKAQPAGPGRVYLVDRQDAAQTMVVQILPAPPRKHDDYYPLRVADAVWGGAASARLSTNIREEKGYSYGVFSFLTTGTAGGVWRAVGTVQTDKTKESVVEFAKELKFLAGAKPVSEKELADAKANLVRGYAQQFESLGRITSQVAYLWSLDLPSTELQREVEQWQSAPLAAVNAAAERYAVPSGAMLLLVGDLAKIEPAIRDLKLGEMVVLDVEGRVVKGGK